MNTHEFLWRNRTLGSKQKVHQSEHKPTSQTSVVSGHEFRAIAAKHIFLIFLHLANIARLKPRKNWIIVHHTTSYLSSFFALHVPWSESGFVHPCFCSRPGWRPHGQSTISAGCVGNDTFLDLAHMMDATQLCLSCHCTHAGCYACHGVGGVGTSLYISNEK